MGNETKERLPLRMKPETSRRLEQWYAAGQLPEQK